jgi:hypothetical protein
MVLQLKGALMDGDGILGAVDEHDILLFSSLSNAVSSLASLFSCSSHHVGLQPFMFLSLSPSPARPYGVSKISESFESLARPRPSR